MKRLACLVLLFMISYLATGLYIVVGNEKAVIRRFGRVVKTPTGKVVLKSSGLHWDLPWPFSRVDRLKLAESQVVRLPVRIGSNELETPGADPFERWFDGPSASERLEFLTGDRNVLEVEASVQYRVSAEMVEDYLFRHEDLKSHLAGMVESVLAETIAACGVDYVHPAGLSELQTGLSARTAELAAILRLGVVVESISIESVSPPARVKADFLDVANARNDRDKFINAARSYASRRQQEARAAARTIADKALADQAQSLQHARAAAQSFDTMVQQFERNPGVPPQLTRQMTMERLYFESLGAVLSRVSGQVLLDSGQPVNLMIPQSQPSAGNQAVNQVQDSDESP